VKLLVLGAGGLMGQHLGKEIHRRNLEATLPDHAQLDITQRDACLRALDTLQPDAVINAAALCNFRACEEHPDDSLRVNLDAALWWATECRQRAIRFAQFTSDYIFDGTKNAPYLETDPPAPLCVYGRHKAELEIRLAAEPNVLLLRVAWIFGLGGHTFMSLMPGQMMEHEILRVAAGKKGSCLHASTGASVTLDLLQAGASGVVNVVQRGETSWEQFAIHCLLEMQARGYVPKCKQIEPMPFSEMNTSSGQRPGYSVLDVTKAETLLGRSLPTWQESLGAYLDEWQKSAAFLRAGVLETTK